MPWMTNSEANTDITSEEFDKWIEDLELGI